MTENIQSGSDLIQNSTIMQQQNDTDTESSSEESESEDISEMELEARDQKEKLEDRLQSLRGTMFYLKKQLSEERVLWQMEVQDAMKTSSFSETSFDLPEEVYDVTEQDVDIFDNESTHFSIAEYEQKLTRYQEALAQAELEKKESLRRQIAVSNYKRKLLEVENMCNLELLRVKQNVQFLQPLQMMVSEWNKAEKMNSDEEIAGLKPIEDSYQPKQKEIAIPVGTKLLSDMNEMFVKMSSQSYSNFAPAAAPSAPWLLNDDYLLQRSGSNVWYSPTEHYSSSAFNPLS